MNQSLRICWGSQSRPSLSKERGVRKPDIPTIEALCDIFNVSADYLIGKDDVTVRIVGKEGLKGSMLRTA